MGKTDGALLSKYEVSVAGASAITLLPTFVVLFFQIIVDLKTGETNNFRIYFVSGAIFLIFLLLSVLLCLRYAKEIMVSRRVLYGGTALLFTGQLLLLAKCYLNSETVYPAMSGDWFPWHSKSDWKMFCLMLGIGDPRPPENLCGRNARAAGGRASPGRCEQPPYASGRDRQDQL